MATKTKTKKFRKNEFVKVTRGKHKSKRGAVIADNGKNITIRTYPFSNYIKVNPRNVVRSDLAGFVN